jgi:hypothetical protein
MALIASGNLLDSEKFCEIINAEVLTQVKKKAIAR